MRIPRLYVDTQLAVGKCIALTERHAKHLINVLRMNAGAQLCLFNGLGGEYQAVIQHVMRNEISVEITDFMDSHRESPLQVTLIQGISRSDKMDLTIRKAVELGVYKILAVQTRRSVVRLNSARSEKKLTHWREIIISACEQCGRNYVPELSLPHSLEDALSVIPTNGVGICMDPGADKTLNSIEPPLDQVFLIAGPEGGFSPDEKNLIEKAGVQNISLGPRILRTETAALAAISVIQILWGDFR
ncbi:MAG: 16S rRNA (uracil(1498)-N(3))-methyltransferase [Gammaproteobacteria bacterium]|nr:16S rRNA (uracil(1498)-N(3))-methyltransferase [Gammaproteobacteria bacterium]